MGGVRRGKKKKERMFAQGDAGVMFELWQSHCLWQPSTVIPDLASRKLFPFESEPGATPSPCREAEHGRG